MIVSITRFIKETLLRASRRVLLCAICLLSIIAVQATAHADIASSGSVLIDWANTTITVTDSVTGLPVALNWFDTTVVPPLDTRGSFSSVATGLNAQLDIYNPQSIDFVDGAPWSNTAASWTETSGSSSVSGSANTGTPPTPSYSPNPFPANQIFAQSILSLTGTDTGAVFAQAVLSGQFTVPSSAYLDISAPYTITQSGFGKGSLSNISDITAALTLSDFDVTDPITGQSLVLASAVASSFQSGNFSPVNLSSTLTIPHFLLSPTILYDFEASATASGSAASAAVPEPISLLFLGSGLIGLVFFRKTSSRNDPALGT